MYLYWHNLTFFFSFYIVHDIYVFFFRDRQEIFFLKKCFGFTIYIQISYFFVFIVVHIGFFFSMFLSHNLWLRLLNKIIRCVIFFLTRISYTYSYSVFPIDIICLSTAYISQGTFFKTFYLTDLYFFILVC